MKKIAVFFLLLISVSLVHAMPIRQLVFFGDSYMDNGNLYKLLLHIMPKSPPYYEGRFSNGPTWAERVGEHYHKQLRIDYRIYAVGGATAIFHPPTSKFFEPTTLYLEVENYLLDTYNEDRSTTLYIIWIGDNDYMFNQDASPDYATQQVVNGITDAINQLIDSGAKRFLVFNLMDTTRTPMIIEQRSPERLRHLVELHNKKLMTALDGIRKTHRNIHLETFDVNSYFNDMLDHPAQYHLTNITKACWTGGLTLQARSYAAQNHTLDTMPCAHPTQYFFWDDMHPTATIHDALANAVITVLDNTMDWPKSGYTKDHQSH